MRNLLLSLVMILFLCSCSKKVDEMPEVFEPISLVGKNLKGNVYVNYDGSRKYYHLLNFKENSKVEATYGFMYVLEGETIYILSDKHLLDYSLSDNNGKTVTIRVFGSVDKSKKDDVFGSDGNGKVDFTGLFTADYFSYGKGFYDVKGNESAYFLQY